MGDKMSDVSDLQAEVEAVKDAYLQIYAPQILAEQAVAALADRLRAGKDSTNRIDDLLADIERLSTDVEYYHGQVINLTPAVISAGKKIIRLRREVQSHSDRGCNSCMGVLADLELK